MTESFYSFFDKFKVRNGGWYPENIDGWVKNVEVNHQSIRAILGGELLQKFYSIAPSSNAISESQIDNYYNLISTKVPNISEKIDKLSLANPVIPSGSHNVLKTSKIILEHVRMAFDLRKISEDTYSEVNRIVSKLGEEWAKNKNGQLDVEVTISTTPRAFCLLGHYGPDEDSCFRQNSSSPYDKYIFGQSQDTFVITIAKHKDGKYSNVARCIGFLSKSKKVLNISNYYFEPKFNEGDGLAVLKKIAEDVFGIKNTTRNDGLVRYLGHADDWTPKGQFYVNPYGIWSFSDKNYGIREEDISIHCNLQGIFSFICPNCNEEHRNKRGWLRVDNVFVCKNCTRLANKCERTKELTMLELVPFVSENFGVIRVHPSHKNRYLTCDSCNNLAEKSSSVNGKTFCTDCIEACCDHCDACGSITFTENITDIDTESFCSDCIKNVSIFIDENKEIGINCDTKQSYALDF